MKISLGADHAGFELKEKIKGHLVQRGIEVQDCGTFTPESVDYPGYARQVGEAVVSGKADCGLLVCGTGIGMSIAANKIPGIRAAHITNDFEARMSREHNDANVITLGARVLTQDTALHLVDTWLDARFVGGQHQRRVKQIGELEREEQKRLV